jgi:hypothetical protein
MDDDLNALFARLANAPTPSSLSGLSDAVILRVHADAALARTGTTVGIVATLGALVLGATNPLVFSTPAPPAPSMPFGVSASLAPSTLLVGR